MVLRGGMAIALLPKKWVDFVIAGDEWKTMWIYMEKLVFEGEFGWLGFFFMSLPNIAMTFKKERKERIPDIMSF
jgi:hypothetical protein